MTTEYEANDVSTHVTDLGGRVSPSKMHRIQRCEFLPKLAEEVMKDASENYKENQKFSQETLHSLHSVFGETLIKAMDVLDTYKFTEYKTQEGYRSLYKLVMPSDHHTLYSPNYCKCETFTEDVLFARESMTCEHVLALKLARIVGAVKVEVVTGAVMTLLLNNQIELFDV